MNRQEKAEELEGQITDALNELSWQLSQGHSEGFLQVLEWYSHFHRYSVSNSILIKLQRPDATIVAGYKRWEAMGFHVRKGEQGIAIRAPWMRKTINEETGEIEERLIGYLVTYVFDIAQTAEYPEKQPPSIYQEVPGDWEMLYLHLKCWVMLNEVHVTEDPMPHGVHGMYSNKHIRINQDMELFHKVTCLIHEYVHHVAHGTPELREGLTRNQREWEAESTVFAVCKAIGIEHPTAKDYLLSYHFTTEDLEESLRKIHGLTKRVMHDLQLLQELPIPKAEKEAA